MQPDRNPGRLISARGFRLLSALSSRRLGRSAVPGPPGTLQRALPGQEPAQGGDRGGAGTQRTYLAQQALWRPRCLQPGCGLPRPILGSGALGRRQGMTSAPAWFGPTPSGTRRSGGGERRGAGGPSAQERERERARRRVPPRSPAQVCFPPLAATFSSLLPTAPLEPACAPGRLPAKCERSLRPGWI